MSVVCSSRSSTICKIPSVDRSDQFLAMSRDREKEQCLDAQLHIHEPVKELGFPETNSSLDKKLHYRSLLVVVTQRFFSAIVAFIYRHLCGYLSLRWSVEMVNDGNSTPTVHANCRNTQPRSLSGMVRLCLQHASCYTKIMLKLANWMMTKSHYNRSHYGFWGSPVADFFNLKIIFFCRVLSTYDWRSVITADPTYFSFKRRLG